MVPELLWKEHKTNLLKQLWMSGFSSSAVVNKMGEHGYNVTRNAVIGKVHRLGLARDPNKKPIIRAPRKKRASPQKTIFFPEKQGGIKIIDQHNGHRGATVKQPSVGKHVLLTKTKDGDCRAIIGYRNGLLAQAICCGETTPWVQTRAKLVRSPWCEYHRNLYVQRETRR